MKVIPRADNSFGLTLSRKELSWFAQTLNECCNGFGVSDCKETLGAGEDMLQHMLDQIVSMYRAPAGHES